MKIQHLLLMAFGFAGTTVTAQTKKIAFESHSGSMENFSLTQGNDFFDNGESDFGLPPNKTAYKLDSVIFISDTVSVLVSKTYSRPWTAKNDSLDKLVGAKKDTVYNDPLFSRKFLLDTIKKMVEQRGQYETTQSTKFVGFDSKKDLKNKQGNKQQWVPFAVNSDPPDHNSPFDLRLAMMVGLILLLSLLGGWISWKFYQPRLQ